MSFSFIIDVAIGLVFVYLLLSLMCSAANEIIELLLKKRAIDLERGIREMLAPGSNSGTLDIVQKLYDHALINNLFDKTYEKSRIASGLRYLWRTHLPSYIPARSFALALMDLVKPAAAAGASGTTGSTPPTNFEVKLNQPPPASPNPGADNNLLTPLRQGIAASPLFDAVPDVRQGLIALVDAAGNDVAKARENIETWFNNSMDRVASWYKRRTQVVILILGLFLTVLMNADSLAIVRKLSTDKSLRDSLVASSVEYAKAHASPAATPAENAGAETNNETGNTAGGSGQGGTNPAPKPSPKATATPTPCPAPTPPVNQAQLLSTIPECKTDKDSLACKEEVLLASIPACNKCKPGKDPKESPQCKLEFNQAQLQSLNLPIGWGSVDDDHRKWPGWDFNGPNGWWAQLGWHWLGWLLTTLAISLGAPFWFDLLNKFIVIRSAVKPHEKSPEEESKD